MLRECPRCDELVVLSEGDETRCDSCGARVPMEDDWTAADEQLWEVEE
jgi:hypothetical protein